MSGKRLNPFQHALKRPDTYIGSIKTVDADAYCLEPDGNVVFRTVKWNTGLMNSIREIGSNCIDNVWRSETAGIKMKSIKVNWNPETHELTFWNDGYHISAEKQSYEYEDYRSGKTSSEEMHPAEVFFGEMLAGTNFEDDEDKVRKTSGRNGMGSKCTNVWSKKFKVRHGDPVLHKIFEQTYANNAKNRTDPKLTAFKGKMGFTEISFALDFERLGYDIDDETVAADFIGMLGMYVLEMAAVTGIAVTYTAGDTVVDKKFLIKSFDKYARVFYPDTTAKMATIKLSNGDECVFVESHNSDPDLPEQYDAVRHLSYVNGVKTADGGVHVDAWRDALFPVFVKAFNARKSAASAQLKTTIKDVFPYITMFIRTEVDKPSFNTQTKDKLNGPAYLLYPNGKTKADKAKVAEFKEEIDGVIKKMLKWRFVAMLEEKLLAKTGGKVAKKVTGRISMGSKAQDANKAGKHADMCTLYITEGLSAKAFVVRGISSIEDGNDYNGAFAIQGKFINTVNNTKAAVAANAEVKMLMQMLNLHIGVDYSIKKNFETLRYSSVCITADMDDDGIHIRGLLINFFHNGWPQLIELGFLTSFSTAVTKVTFSGKKASLMFYSNPEYKRWYESTGASLKIQEVKYLKGLGAINPEDAPGYFSDRKEVKYYAEGDEIEYMKLGFDKNSADLRKEWLVRDMKRADDVDSDDASDDDPFVYNGELGISTFVDSQLVIYHRMTLRRALPNLMDGFKEGQRKIFYAIRKVNSKNTKNLEKVIGSIKDLSGYHHGSASLLGAVRHMAIRYPGSNNIPLLQDDGEYGTRKAGGEDAAAARYLATGLEPIVNAIFCKDDDALLTQVIEDNELAEVEFFLPVICMLLVNGANGIASGYSTNIPNYNPIDIADWIEAWTNGTLDELSPLVPWYRGIKGPITLEKSKKSLDKPNQWRTEGLIEECHKGCKLKVGKRKCKGTKGWWHITDLPVGVWADSFAEHLEVLKHGGTKGKKVLEKCITDWTDHCSANMVHFMIKPSNAGCGWIPRIKTTLKIMTTTNTLTNMHTIDANNYPTRHESPESILRVWCPQRLAYYEKRHAYLMQLEEHIIQRASNRYKYVRAVVDKELEMYQPDEDLYADMEEMGLTRMTATVNDEGKEPGFEYLLSMQMRSMTEKKLKEIEREENAAKKSLDELKAKTGGDLWQVDLAKFRTAYATYIKSRSLD